MEGQTKLSAGQIGILINARIKDMAMWLMEDFMYSLEEALDCVYNVIRKTSGFRDRTILSEFWL